MLKKKPLILQKEQLVSGYLIQSDFYEIKYWNYNFIEENEGMNGYNDCLCMVFVKRGTYLFDYYRDRHEMHSGHIMIEKPNYPYRLRPSYGECTLFNFKDGFYQQLIEDLSLKNSFFFDNENLLSIALKATPECDYLHYQILLNASKAGRLEIDCHVLELVKQIIETINNSQINFEIDAALTKFHLPTIERAKEFIHNNFTTDISLQEISVHSHVSPFYFSRIFKKITSYSPIQYLQMVRLKNSEMLLKNTSLPIADVALSSGFSTAEYFATVFKQKYKTSPTQFRK